MRYVVTLSIKRTGSGFVFTNKEVLEGVVLADVRRFKVVHVNVVEIYEGTDLGGRRGLRRVVAYRILSLPLIRVELRYAPAM